MAPNAARSHKRRALTGPEKVAVLLLALDRPRATQLLKRFEPEEIRLITLSAADLPPVSPTEFEAIVEEFAGTFKGGTNFTGSMGEIRSLLTEVLTEEQIAEIFGERIAGEGEDQGTYERVAQLKKETLYEYLERESPQSAAFVLSRMDSSSAAEIFSICQPHIRNDLLVRMLAIRKVPEDAAAAVEQALREDLLARSSRSSHGGIAGILNKLEKEQSEEALKALAETRPDDAKTLKSMLFKFEDLTKLDKKSLSVILEQTPVERLILALRGMSFEFQTAALESLSARSKRMVEAELQGESGAPQKDIVEARRGIVDTVLRLASRGEIVISTGDDG